MNGTRYRQQDPTPIMREISQAWISTMIVRYQTVCDPDHTVTTLILCPVSELRARLTVSVRSKTDSDCSRDSPMSAHLTMSRKSSCSIQSG